MPLCFQAAKFKDPRDACAAIVAESYRLWLQYETRTDDITVIIVHVNGLTEVWYFSCFILLLFNYIPRNSLSFIYFIVSNWSNLPNQSTVAQSASYGDVLQKPVPQVVEVTGSESPSTFGWSARNQRVRHDLSRARLRALENSLENGQAWVPPPSAHRKTWEEEVIPHLIF